MKLNMTEHRFPSWDGLAMFYRAWRPAEKAKRAVVIFHRGHEHSGRWAHLVDALAPEGFAVFAWDARGNGRTDGPRDDAPHFSAFCILISFSGPGPRSTEREKTWPRCRPR
jgi:alpha-beta hydrolase superfamily lysophospholipase